MTFHSNSEFVAPVVTDGPTLAGAAIHCPTCGSPVSKNSKSGLCRQCSYKARYRPTPHCCDCGIEISRAARARCRPCATTHLKTLPDLKKRQADGIRRRFRDPAHRAKMALVAARNGSKYWTDPEHRPVAVERGKMLYREYLSKPETRERCVAAIRANSWKITEHYLSWCPVELRDEYRKLQKRWRSGKRARAFIEEKIREQRVIAHPEWHTVLDHMRRLTAVVRLDNGNYRVGLAELTPGQLLERAEAKGYELPKWAA